jgi:hypothetical protein
MVKKSWCPDALSPPAPDNASLAFQKFHGNEGFAVSSPRSWIVQMLGWFSAEAACASL